MWRIALPLILSNISVPLLGMVDTGVVGHLENAAYLGAVAVGSTIFGFLYTGVNFLRMGTTGIAAQRFGANDYDGLRVSLGQALIVSSLIAVLLIALQWPLRVASMFLIGPDAEVASHADEYFRIRIWSAPATLGGYALVGLDLIKSTVLSPAENYGWLIPSLISLLLDIFRLKDSILIVKPGRLVPADKVQVLIGFQPTVDFHGALNQLSCLINRGLTALTESQGCYYPYQCS